MGGTVTARLLRIGVPIELTIVAEAGMFIAVTFLIGLLGTAALAVAEGVAGAARSSAVSVLALGIYECQTSDGNLIGGERGMKFRPLHDRVLVQRMESEDKTAGGIIIPDTAKEKPMEGKIIAVGSGARDETGKVQPLDVKEGDAVLFGKWSGTEVKVDGEDHLIMKESDIMGIIT